MTDLTSVTKGIKSHRFHEYTLNGYALDEPLCFSLLFSERSFDFQAESAQDCQDIVGRIQLLRESS